jgi:sterol desaturase/sphingolipid hydroxylase (fatty acid hydroxylase superfamily)
MLIGLAGTIDYGWRRRRLRIRTSRDGTHAGAKLSPWRRQDQWLPVGIAGCTQRSGRSLLFALLTFILGKRRRLGAIGVLLIAAAYALGGYTIETGPVEPSPLAFGLDWLILAFVVSAILFMFLVFCADFVLYWSHRAFHEVPRLWRIHAVHHSVEHMDWMAGSRNHVVQTFVDRCLVMVPLYLLGTTKEALDLYVAFAAFQAVYVHANVGIPLGPLKYFIATPQYHHWHHSSQSPAIDTNYAVHMPFYDRLFGTYHMPDEHWPSHYGTTKRLPRTWLGQLLYPFRSG